MATRWPRQPLDTRLEKTMAQRLDADLRVGGERLMNRTAADRLATADIKARANKYGATRCRCDQGGTAHTHDSLAERQRCFVLTQRERLGEIRNLHRHSRWPLEVNGQRVGIYTDDASYYLLDGTFVVEDTKSPATRRTEAYRLRRKMFAAQYGFEITETE